jgi:hypothetical protein
VGGEPRALVAECLACGFKVNAGVDEALAEGVAQQLDDCQITLAPASLRFRDQAVDVTLLQSLRRPGHLTHATDLISRQLARPTLRLSPEEELAQSSQVAVNGRGRGTTHV